MAITFYQKPISDSATVPVLVNYTPVVPYTITRTSGIGSLFYYKIVLEIYTGSTGVADNKIAELKQTRNPYPNDLILDFARAIFDVGEIIKTELDTTRLDLNDTVQPINPIWKISLANVNVLFSSNNSQVRTITVRASESYSTSATAIPTKDITGAITDSKIYINGSEDLAFPRSAIAFNYQPSGVNAVMYENQLSGDTKRFLSEMPLDTVKADFKSYNYNNVGGLKYIHYVTDLDWQCLGFMNGADQFGSNARGFVVEYYNGESAGNFYFFRNDTGNGGEDPVAGATLNDEDLILYMGVAPKNLEEQAISTSARPSNQFSGAWTHYRIFAVSDIVTYPSIASYTPMSADYWFVKGCGNTVTVTDAVQRRYRPVRLSWLNKFGCWETYTFFGKSTEVVEITKTEYEKMLGNFSDQIYSYSNYERQKATSTVSSKVKLTIGTEYISERLVPYIESLIKSKEVYKHHSPESSAGAYNLNSPEQAVIVTQSNFVRKNSANDKMIQYSISLEYANNFNTNAQ